VVPEHPAGKVCTRLVRLSLVSALLFPPIAGHAAESVKIYRSTMPDGSVMLGDRPTPGARSVVTGTYVLATPPGAADAEREYWRRQSEAFDLRQQRREVEAHRRSVSPRRAAGAAIGDEHVHRFSHPYVTGYTPGYAYAPRPPIGVALPHASKPLVPRRETQHRPVRSHGGSDQRGSGVPGYVPGPVR
jgi:hypothetical protein